jgi:hypothetical protein
MHLYDEGVRRAAAIMSLQPPTYRRRFVFHPAANLWGKRQFVAFPISSRTASHIEKPFYNKRIIEERRKRASPAMKAAEAAAESGEAGRFLDLSHTIAQMANFCFHAASSSKIYGGGTTGVSGSKRQTYR